MAMRFGRALMGLPGSNVVGPRPASGDGSSLEEAMAGILGKSIRRGAPVPGGTVTSPDPARATTPGAPVRTARRRPGLADAPLTTSRSVASMYAAANAARQIGGSR
jgi:hypothetical protein